LVGKIIRLLVGVATMHLLLATGVVRAQSPSPEALAAARELMQNMHLDEQYKAVLPALFKNMKAVIVQGRAEVERQYEALAHVCMFDI
jgi:cytochrome c-type biogenesis protein CcmE